MMLGIKAVASNSPNTTFRPFHSATPKANPAKAAIMR